MTKSYSPIRQTITQKALDEKTGINKYRRGKKQAIPWTSFGWNGKIIKLTQWNGRWMVKAVDLVVALGLDTQVSGKTCRQLEPSRVTKTSPGRVGHWLVSTEGLRSFLQLCTAYGATNEAARRLEAALHDAVMDLITPSAKDVAMEMARQDTERIQQRRREVKAKQENQVTPKPDKAPATPAPAPVEPITCAHLAVMFKAISEVEGKVPDRATKALLDAVVKVSNGAVK